MRVLLIIAAVALGGAFGVKTTVPASVAQEATPAATPAAAVAIASEVLGRAQPAAVAEPELALARVTVMPGAVLPVHHHPGTQIGVVVQGELTYTVMTGEIEWYGAGGSSEPPSLIQPGQTVTVGVGEALVESPGSIHQGRNEGAVPLVIYLSTLFPTGAPRAIVIEATPAAG